MRLSQLFEITIIRIFFKKSPWDLARQLMSDCSIFLNKISKFNTFEATRPGSRTSDLCSIPLNLVKGYGLFQWVILMQEMVMLRGLLLEIVPIQREPCRKEKVEFACCMNIQYTFRWHIGWQSNSLFHMIKIRNGRKESACLQFNRRRHASFSRQKIQFFYFPVAWLLWSSLP